MWEDEIPDQQTSPNLLHRKIANIMIINTFVIILIITLYIFILPVIASNALFLVSLLVQTLIYMYWYNTHIYSSGLLIFLVLDLIGSTLVLIPNKICFIMGFIVLFLSKSVLCLTFMLVPYCTDKIRFVFNCKKWHISIIIFFILCFVVFSTFCITRASSIQVTNIEIIIAILHIITTTFLCFFSIARINLLETETQISVLFAMIGTIMLLFSAYISAYNNLIGPLPYYYLFNIIIEWTGLFLISCSVVRNWKISSKEKNYYHTLN